MTSYTLVHNEPPTSRDNMIGIHDVSIGHFAILSRCQGQMRVGMLYMFAQVVGRGHGALTS